MPVIRFNCPACGVPLKFDDAPPEGKKFHCPKCKANIKVAAKKDAPTGTAHPWNTAPEPAFEPATGPSSPAPVPPRVLVESAAVDPDRSGPAALRDTWRSEKRSSDLPWKLVAGSIGVILLACLLLLAFWNYLPK